MKIARIHEFGGPRVIVVDDVPRPEPGPGQVLVRVAATSFNPTEVAVRAGRFDLPLPHALGWDVAGTVAGAPVVGWIDGAAAEYAVTTPDRLVPAPTTIPLADAAALPLAGLSAWQMVFEHGDVRPGHRVLVNGAGGGIGGFAVQLAKHAGAHVTATASPRSAATVRGLGADEVVGYGPRGRFDVVLNLVADAEVARLGAVVVSATLSDAPDAHFVTRFDADQLTRLVDLVDRGVVVVDVSERHGLPDLPELHRRAEAGDLRGKVLVTP
ncbi:NADP-dependent oxidoreductase [Saccharothrix sp. S26]|uniref:NADP-dependent oxidoreductase n=1 Tax=Saccharothrix sp. S26 TaxID=2907215 RepID=UPI001F254F78|nr:NADP-dependent oxidoreductase [Saccharothrix sp. S26]MCE6994153.1 NADP-dependent oxidoreductase [Saccharothrix sp. S26]